MLLRLAFRPDQALVGAVLGIAAAVVLPVASTLVLMALEPEVTEGWIAYAAGPGASGLEWGDAVPAPTAVLGVDPGEPHRVAYLVGDPVVEPGHMLAMPEAEAPSGTPRSARFLQLVPVDAILVHPDELPDGVPRLAYFTSKPTVSGAVVAPARGADAFEASALEELQSRGMALVVPSMAAVGLIAAAFARQEVRAQSRRSATLDALGGRRAALALLAGRMAVASLFGVALATAIGFVLWKFGGPLFRPVDTQRLPLAVAILVPGAFALAVGLITVALSRPVSLVRAAAEDVDDDVVVRFPLPWRPLLLGLRLMPVLLLTAAVFAADVGFPAATIRIPANLAGGEGEWVRGVDAGLLTGSGVDAAVADVAGLDPRVDAILAESVSPTLMDGRPVVVRGGHWAALSAYHGLRLRAGTTPDAGEVVLGSRLADRLAKTVGDEVIVQASAIEGLHILVIAGIATGPEGMPDEAYVGEATGRHLAALAPGKASLVRFRPQSDEALAAVDQRDPSIVVAGLRVVPADPSAGTLATARVSVANLGSEPGQRDLVLRIQGAAVANLTAVLVGHGTRDFDLPFLVPTGEWRLEVNPSSSGDAAAAELEVTAASPVLAGQDVVATVMRSGQPASGVTVALYADLTAAQADQRLASSATDQEGRARLRCDCVGEVIVGALGEPAVFTQVEVVSATGALAVKHVWTVPATVSPGEPATLHALVRNPGATAANGTIPAYAGETWFAGQDVRLEPGATTVVFFRLFLVEIPPTVRVGDVALPLGSRPALLPETPPIADPPPVHPGESVQALAAGRALGDAEGVLLALGGSAVVSTLAVVFLVTRRTLAGRRHVVRLLHVLGQTPDQVRSRAALEGAFIGGVALLAMLLPAKVLFIMAGRYGPAVFGHSLPDPIGWVFALQSTAAFASACALAAYLGCRPGGPAQSA